MTLPTLYSFRRCPYAIRARLAIRYAGIEVELREVELKNKPAEMLAASPKGTVPVLIDSMGEIIDESLDIMRWALSINDPDRWLQTDVAGETQALIDKNDCEFKNWLDKYKYAVRFPEQDEAFYAEQCKPFLQKLEASLSVNRYLNGDSPSLADYAIFPFVRQFNGVDPRWLNRNRFNSTQQWLESLLESVLFNSVMRKYKPWSAELKNAVIF